MRVVVVGYGVQGKKRKAIAGDECVAVIDTIDSAVEYTDIRDVPVEMYDAALICTPDHCKYEILDYLATYKKHAMIEKPLWDTNLKSLECQANEQGVVFYTAYNHRFEPHFVKMKEVLDSGVLGEIYHGRLFYGNGTARDVKNSPWRDQGSGVLKDLGSHLLDTLLFWFGFDVNPLEMIRCHRFENNSPDHIIIGNETLELEMSLLSWRNHFTCDIFGELGSAHISSLCKWGPSTFTLRKRTLPSGRPTEQQWTLVQPDPTWEAEYQYFKGLCEKGVTDLKNDAYIYESLQNLSEVFV